MGEAITLIHCRQPPYSSSLSRGALELAMAMAVFDQKVQLLFSGDGVWQLVTGQLPEVLQEKNHSKLISALPMYDIETLYVDADALAARSLTAAELCLPVELLSKTDISTLFSRCQQIFNF